ncbi:MAG: hypothetical protein HY098_01425 [Nitrospinae bacterium]|nr:hypothetical protein [Nitrospinota bacterium]
MGIELTNGRLALATGSNAPHVQKIRPMSPSFAEGAVFIPKPYKRVEFRLELPVQRAGEYGGKEGNADSAASNAPKVVMRVDPDPQKDYSVISLQQEGRQINHGSSVYFLQQYDAYGRPRMGMSREPYDFAFTKFMVKTSQLKCEENVKASNDDAKGKTEAATGAPPNAAPRAADPGPTTDSNRPPPLTPISILA